MYLCTADFRTEQIYHRYARELLNSGIFTPGVVEGLTVTLDGDALPTQATVSPGRALDDGGRLMVLADDAQVPLDALVSGHIYSIIVNYDEANDDPPGDKATRTVEKPNVQLVARPPAAGEVLLASLSLVDGKIAIDSAWGSQGTRRHAGAILGSIEFPLEAVAVPHLLLPPDPTPISIAARGYATGDSPVLEITAPYIALYGNVSASGSLSVDQMTVKDLTVTEEATVDGPLSVDGPLNVTDGAATDTLVVGGGALTSGSVLTVNGVSSFMGNTTIGGQLDVTETLEAGGLVTASAGLSVADGAATDTLVVGGGVLTSGSVLTVNGSADISEGLAVTGTITAGALSIDGALDADSLKVKDLTVTDQATVDAPLMVDGKLTVTDGATTNTLVVGGGSLSLGSALTVAGASALDGKATITGSLTVSETVTASGKVTANAGVATNALVVGGASATFGAALTVNGDSSLNGNAAISEGLTVDGTLKALGKVTASAGMSVTGGAATDALVAGSGALTPGSILTVNGPSSLNGSSTVHGPLTVAETVTAPAVSATTLSATNISSQGFNIKSGNLNCLNFAFDSIPIETIQGADSKSFYYWGPYGGYQQDAIVTISLASNNHDNWNGIPIGDDHSSSFFVQIDQSGLGAIHAPIVAFKSNFWGNFSIMGSPITFVLPSNKSFTLGLAWQWTYTALQGCAFEVRTYKFGGSA
jgi:cytoskeletal protein CcmA (bactofilin family)